MKKSYLILLIMLISSLIHSQEDTTLATTTKSTSKKQATPPYISIITRWGHLSAIGGGSPYYTTPTLWALVEVMIPVNFKPMYLYTQFRSSIPLSCAQTPLSEILPVVNLETYRVGFLVGLGGYIHDWRNQTGKGWSLSLNSGFVMEFGIANHNSLIRFDFSRNPDNPQQFINLGFDINIRGRYNFHKYAGITLGLDFGYMRGISSGDSFYLGLEQYISSLDMISYSFVLGLHF